MAEEQTQFLVFLGGVVLVALYLNLEKQFNSQLLTGIDLLLHRNPA